MLNQALIEVFTAQEGIAVGGEHFKLLLPIHVGNLNDRNIKGAATEVEHSDLAIVLGLLVKAERQRGGGRFVDDALDFEPCDPTGVFSGLTLGIIKVSRNRDHRFGDVFAKIVLGGLFHFAQHFGRHLRGRQLATA